MVVDADEGAPYTLGYGFGFEVRDWRPSPQPSTPIPCDPTTDCAQARVAFSKFPASNMFGRAQTLSFKVRASTLQYRTVLTYSADNFLAIAELSLQLTVFADKTQDVNTFTSTRYEGQCRWSQKLSPSSSLLYRYFFSRVSGSDVKGTIQEDRFRSIASPLWSPDLASPMPATAATIPAMPSPALQHHRPEHTPRRRSIPAPISSAASFQNSSFTSFGREFVFARSVRFGIEHLLGNNGGKGRPRCRPPATNEPARLFRCPNVFFRRRQSLGDSASTKPARAIPARAFPSAAWLCSSSIRSCISR